MQWSVGVFQHSNTRIEIRKYFRSHFRVRCSLFCARTAQENEENLETKVQPPYEKAGRRDFFTIQKRNHIIDVGVAQISP